MAAIDIPFGIVDVKKGGWRFFFGEEQCLYVGINIT